MINKEEWRTKLDSLKQIVKEQPENGEAWLKLATFLHEECDSPEYEVKAYENARKYLPEEDLRMQLGAAYADAGHYDRGITLLEQYIKDNSCAEGYVFLSEAFRQAGRNEEAINAIKMAITIEPTFEEPYFVLGNLMKEEFPIIAIDNYRKATDIDNEYQAAWRELGALLIQDIQTLEEGIKALNHAISLKPDDGWAHMYLGIGYWKANRLDEADSEYRRAIEEFPDIPLFKEYYEDFCAFRDMQ
jgi:tetratricopeptide (TPR) repeat protein